MGYRELDDRDMIEAFLTTFGSDKTMRKCLSHRHMGTLPTGTTPNGGAANRDLRTGFDVRFSAHYNSCLKHVLDSTTYPPRANFPSRRL
jgi:hypothetical protein